MPKQHTPSSPRPSNVSNVRQVFIASNDKDMYQLVNSCVQVVPLKKGSLQQHHEFVRMGEKEVFDKMRVEPSQYRDYAALVGDPADNIPGVKGVGSKTAAALLQKHRSLSAVLEAAEAALAAETFNKQLFGGTKVRRILSGAFFCRACM